MLTFEKKKKANFDSICSSCRVMLLSFFLVLFLNFVVKAKSKKLAVFGSVLHERLQTNFHITYRCCYPALFLIFVCLSVRCGRKALWQVLAV